MIHPLLKRLAIQPGLFVEHAGAYAELAGAEARLFGQRCLRRTVLVSVAVAGGVLALCLAGVAAMLAGALPLQDMPAPWALWLVPLLPALLAGGCAWAARGGAGEAAFTLLRRQVEADAQLLREVGPS